jgi:hypothetical protein
MMIMMPPTPEPGNLYCRHGGRILQSAGAQVQDLHVAQQGLHGVNCLVGGIELAGMRKKLEALEDQQQVSKAIWRRRRIVLDHHLRAK